MLTLYRRHRLDCLKKYPRNERLFRPKNQRERNKDCDCPISAEGKLKNEFITNRSTKKTDWAEAEAVATQWVRQGSTETPDEPQTVTVEYAVTSFLASQGPSGRNVEPSTYHGFEVLLNRRLAPYSEGRGFRLLSAFDDLDVTTKFVESWTNLMVPGPLADSTKKTELERLRAFFAYCVDRKWLKDNYAKKIKYSFRTEPKFGMSPEEEAILFTSMKPHTDLHTFCQVMRWAGLRISDATMLNHTQIIRRASGDGWAIQIPQTKKTKETVYVPVPMTLVEALNSLQPQCEVNGRKYWFWSGACEVDTAKDNWYIKVMRVVNRNRFLHPVTPHTFRHTFAISHLNAGVDIKLVSRWLSHSQTTVTEQHYAHAIHGTLVASDEAFDRSLKQQCRA